MPMVALGCKYLRVCHLNNCATGVATHFCVTLRSDGAVIGAIGLGLEGEHERELVEPEDQLDEADGEEGRRHAHDQPEQ